jgi:CheY-like chemotaxis protein
MKLNQERIFAILREVLARLSRENPSFSAISEFSPSLDENTTLDSLHVTDANISELAKELRHRLGGVALNVELMYRMQKAFQGTPMDMNKYNTLGDVAKHIEASLHHGIANPMVVYVDDEEENLFIFRRKFGKRFNLRTYANSQEALGFIKDSPDVVLVVTDEVMPGMTGNQLCDEVHKSKPFLKFILITGNPSGDDNLLHRTLRHGRFYDFINKPLDLERKGEEYFEIINRVVSGDFF